MLDDKIKANLKQCLLDHSLTQDQLDQLFEYVKLIEKWNKTYNLTAIRDPLEMVKLHIMDALSVLPYVKASNAKTILDVGAGAGLPSIPLAICMPNLTVVAVDKVQKKTSFMQHVKTELRLRNFSVKSGRVELMASRDMVDTGFDIIISRAFSEIELFVRLTRHLLSTTGHWFAMKGVMPNGEIAALKVLGEFNVQVHPLELQGLEVDRHLIDIAWVGK